MENELKFTAKSGNVCRYQVVENGINVGISAWWKHKPTEKDKLEFIRYSTKEIRAEFPDVNISDSTQGPGIAGKARSTEAIRRFLETGDPGVPVTKRNL